MLAQRIRAHLPAIFLCGVLLLSGCGAYYDERGPGGHADARARAPAAQAPSGATGDFTPVPPPGAATIPLPADGVHVVVRGNTVYSISRLYGVPVRAVIEANDLQPPYLLKVGDRIALPGRNTHRVERGETVYGISRRYNLQMSELMRVNGISPPYRIFIGQELLIPTVPATTTRDSAPAAPAPAQAATPPPKATPKQIAALPKPAPRASRTFEWPVKGRIVSRFGSQANGRHNDGINISAARGSTVVAAENGVVAYAGNELRGFGNLVLLRHADGYMTAYAHNESLLVGRGATVRKGQPIARVGSTGSVAQPQLHFEIRKGRKAVDPLRHLPRQSARN